MPPAQSQQAPAQAAAAEQPLPQPQLNKKNAWSLEAEQLETGNWQMVQFDTTLGAANYSSSGPLPQGSANQSPRQSYLLHQHQHRLRYLCHRQARLFLSQPHSRIFPWRIFLNYSMKKVCQPK